MHATSGTWPFTTLETAFRLLGDDERLTVDGRTLGGRLPARPIRLAELRDRLLHPSCDFDTRDRVIAELAARARRDGGAWTVAVAGMLLPGLRRVVAPLCDACPGRAADLQAEALVGLLDALTYYGDARTRLAARMIGRARDHARRLLTAELAVTGRHVPTAVAIAPPEPWGHPDLVLADAVAAKVITAADSELIGETRVGGVGLHDYAEQLGEAYQTVKRRRARAEQRLVSWLVARKAA